MAKVTMKCWHCKGVIESKDDLAIEKVNNVNRKFHNELGCLESFKNQKALELKEKQDKEKYWEEWCALYEYVKRDVLKYSDKMQLSEHTRRKLLELRNGGLIKNHEGVTDNGYPFPVILMTFKVKKLEIDRALDNINFENETQKVNYIMAIIKNSINDVYLRVLAKNKRDEMVKNQSNTAVQSVKKVEYVKKSEINKGSLFDDIW